MNCVFIVPTGIGAQIGGHAGDATPSAKLIAACCDKLIVHPNVVNASDINEMTDNMLYVEGSMLNKFLGGGIYLEEVRSHNKILLAVNRPVANETINAVSAARAVLGADIQIVVLQTPLEMIATFDKNGNASGDITGHAEMINQLQEMEFDALAIASKITVSVNVAENYLTCGGVNPWGGVEAKLSKILSEAFYRPVAHSPFGDTLKNFNEIVDPRMAAEMVSTTYLHSVLKGLHKAPVIRLTTEEHLKEVLYVDDIDFMISPMDCFGPPHSACIHNNIPIISVDDNFPEARYKYGDDYKPVVMKNYLEAAGYIMMKKAGITLESTLRPFAKTKIIDPVEE